MIGLLLILGLVVIVAISCIQIVPQANAYVVERMGAYLDTWNVGFHIKLPLIDRVAKIAKIVMKKRFLK